MACQGCGLQPVSHKYCTECGADLRDRHVVCTGCGYSYRPAGDWRYKYCPMCGVKFEQTGQ